MTGVLDGNALAGPLSSVFTADTTAATAECTGCGRAGALATGLVYGAPMGLVLRCPDCDSVLMRVVESPAAVTVDMRGISSLRITRRTPADRE